MAVEDLTISFGCHRWIKTTPSDFLRSTMVLLSIPWRWEKARLEFALGPYYATRVSTTKHHPSVGFSPFHTLVLS